MRSRSGGVEPYTFDFWMTDAEADGLDAGPLDGWATGFKAWLAENPEEGGGD